MHKAKSKKNVAKPKRATDATPPERTTTVAIAHVAIREAKLELLDNLVIAFTNLIQEIKAVV